MPAPEGYTALPVRLAMRHEGKEWVAYFSELGSMKRATRLGSIKMTLVARAERKQAFLDLMTECMLDVIEDVTGKRPDKVDATPAPESERSGHG